jgi:uncharacterized protein YbjT (DUF2867 family)
MGGTILVAGATGNTGRALVRVLAKRGMAVRAAARRRTRLLGLGATEVAEVDYNDPSSLARALRGVEKVYLAVPLVDDLAVVTEQVVTAAVKAGIRHFVKLSGIGADRPQDLLLGCWHRQAERVVESSGLAWTHLRPNSFMQNFTNNHLGSMRTRGLFHDPVGGGRVSYIDVEDIAATAAVVLSEPGHENRIYALTGPEAVSSHQVAALLGRAAGRDIRCIEVSVDAARDAMFGFGVPLPVVNAVAELYLSMRSGHLAQVTSTVPDVTGQVARSFAQFAADQQSLFR